MKKQAPSGKSRNPAPSPPAAKPMIVFPPDLWKKAQEEQDEYERENGSPVPQVWPVGD